MPLHECPSDVTHILYVPIKVTIPQVPPLLNMHAACETTTTTTTTTSQTATPYHQASTMAKENKDGELECDLEKSPTNIYLLLQKGEWEGVEHQAKHFPEEVKTFVYRRDASGFVKWRLLPIHCAILHDAPLNVLETLIKAYKAGAKAVDDRGMLPIHLAIKKHVSPEGINLLLAAYPKCIEISNESGLTPYQMAQKSSSPHKAYYLRALKPGSSTYEAVTSSFSDLLCGIDLSADPRTAFGLLASQ